MKLLALGDSYTIGEGVPVIKSWPKQLQKTLKDQGKDIDSVKIIAKTGWRTDELLLALEKANLEKQFDYVSLLIGVNNQYQHIDFEQFQNDFILLLDKAISLCSNEQKGVFVISIPDYSYTPFGKLSSSISGEIERYNNFILETCEKQEIQFIDINPICETGYQNHSLLVEDQLHPSESMYELWSSKILEHPIFQ